METNLNGVSETLLIPLWARAVETHREAPIIRDPQAVRIMGQLNYDFSKFSKAWMSQVGVAIRTMLLDRAVEAFVFAHPDGVVINIGAGLDTRFFRIDNGDIDWCDLDLPEAIEVRREFFRESPQYRMVSNSVFDFSWIDSIDTSQRPVLLIAEGVLMYFDEASVRRLMDRLVEAFPAAEMLLEVMTPTLVGKAKHHDSVGRMNADFRWGIPGGQTMESYNSHISFVAEWNYFDYHRDRWRWMGWLARIPAFKNRFSSRIVHLRFMPKGIGSS